MIVATPGRLLDHFRHPYARLAGLEVLGRELSSTGSRSAADKTASVLLRTWFKIPAEASPLRQAASVRRPLLLAYGASDRRVSVRHGTTFHDAVRRTNPDVEWVVYGDERHGWRTLETEVDFWTRVERFLGHAPLGHQRGVGVTFEEDAHLLGLAGHYERAARLGADQPGAGLGHRKLEERYLAFRRDLGRQGRAGIERGRLYRHVGISTAPGGGLGVGMAKGRPELEVSAYGG